MYPPAPAPPRHDAKGTVIAVIGVVITVIGLALALFAWLDPKPPDSTTTDPNERAPYLAEVDGICGQFKPKIVGLGQPPAEPDAGATWFAEQARLHEELLMAWARLGMPTGDDELVRAILDPLEQEVVQLKQVAQLLQLGNLEAADAAFLKVNDLRAEFRSNARAYGLRVCHDL